MKISKLEFENFRNFKSHGVIEFPTDGRVSIIHGLNGVGKTTLHQMFQWLFYGEVHFNKTTGNKMYNLAFEKGGEIDESTKVFVRADFEHPNLQGDIEHYSLCRTWFYKRLLKGVKLDSESFVLLRMIEDDWKLVKEPSVMIERILPKGLSPYFFFDGESMIADLNQKGKDSAKNLRRALFTIFDLDIYEEAIKHIGSQKDGNSTVIGRLYGQKTDGGAGSELINLKGEVNQGKNKVEEFRTRANELKDKIKNLQNEIKNLSEIIGNTKEKAQLERTRAKKNESIIELEKSIEDEKKRFGQDIFERYPSLLLAKIVKDAENRIGLSVEEEKLLPGFKREFIEALLLEDHCICGHPLGDEERNNLTALFEILPPNSYKSMYDNFKKSAERWSSKYDEALLGKHINNIIKYDKLINDLKDEIRDIDEDLIIASEKDSYIKERNEKEEELSELEKKWTEAEKNLSVWIRLRDQRMKKYDLATEANESNKTILQRIKIMEEVGEYFSTRIKEVAEDFSRKLERSIQDLLNQMMTSKRQVSMSSDFELMVKDSYGDESKSEGQFAVVTFAYIAGILKLLTEESMLKNKEFPLILDGPFSKLDTIQRQNVINIIPQYAPQVILFSKDDLYNCFEAEMDDCVWTMYSNDEKNDTVIKKGYDREVFNNNGISK